MVLPTLAGARCHLTLPCSVAITEVMERGVDQGRRMARLGKVYVFSARGQEGEQKAAEAWIYLGENG